MGFWIFIFLCTLLVPGIMLLFGRMFLKKPPRNINSLFGYRTAMSMKNRDTWAFAHAYCGKLWWSVGWGMLCVSVVVMLSVLGRDLSTVSAAGGVLCGLQCVILVGTILPVERALKRTFDQFGRRRA